MSDRDTVITDEDSELFRQAVGDVRPIRDDSATVQRRRPPARARFRRQDDQAVVRESLEGDWDEPLETGEELRFARPGLNGDVLRRLRRGRIPVRDQLDLHGMNWREAQECLRLFFAECHDMGYGCVRIVHGKGLRSGNRGPVLKTKLNTWLQKRDDILAFCSARPNDGGTGAVYVLLQR
ncbi:Smr/MutS family protein [Gammaproteobacteria bacterium AB-CW1]|uniref:Smr/MutS family protein n=1 Tax=Natronospira elongata TaxID=3110268 RepID=A0AAP6JFS0_9GAMM|nr:Smr/MutS family protein [Gammaproteobacteria bacterium AB-CW1]